MDKTDKLARHYWDQGTLSLDQMDHLTEYIRTKEREAKRQTLVHVLGDLGELFADESRMANHFPALDLVEAKIRVRIKALDAAREEKP